MTTINKSTMAFLSDLKKNNNKDWFHENKERFTNAKQNALNLTRFLILEIGKFDKSIIGTQADACLFRIYKDARFSKDKIPYKTNFGAFVCPGGRKAGLAGYYFHIQPNNCFLGGGLYHPEPERLALIRTDIDKNPTSLKKIIQNPDFKKQFKELKGDQLKTIPRGYPKDHPQKELLRYKDYLASKNIDDKIVTSNDYFDISINIFKNLKPLVTYINKIIV